ncbi:hypothetical protein EON65_32275 [archaeon]|nr:MAG: hypothetical protein EON65_32275 [archaeon]
MQGNPQIAREGVQVKYSLYRVKNEELASPSKNAALQRAPVAEFFTSGRLHTGQHSDNQESDTAMNSARTSDSKRPGTSDNIFTLDCDEIILEQEFNGLFELTCQLSFNLQDFAGNLGKAEVVSTICHSFEAETATPSTYAIAELQRLASLMADEEENYDDQQLVGFERKITVHGNSFFPSHKLAKGSHVVAIWSGYKVIEKESSGEDSQPILEPLEDMTPIPVHCETVENFSFTLTAQNLKQVYNYLNSKGLIPTSLGFQMLLTFQMECSHGDEQVDVLPLNSPPLSLYFYSESPLEVNPVYFKRCDVGQKFCVIPVGTDGFIFNPTSSLVKVSFINELLPPLIIGSHDLIVETVYIESTEGEGETDGDRVVSREKVAKGYSIGFSMPSYADFTRNYAHVDHTQVTKMSVTVALDGISYCTEENAAHVSLFSDLAKYTFQPAVPKGGATANSVVGLLLEQYCPAVIPTENIRISLYGEDVTTGSIIQGTLTDTTVGGQTMSLIQFNMPDQPTLSKIGPVMQGKEKMLYIDVSIDGGETYDKAERPMLQMK